MKYTIYCDGSCSNNQKKENRGGWAYVILKGSAKIFEESGGIANTTNNRMELTAAINALNQISKSLGGFDKVEIYTDSSYLCNCKNNNWYQGWQRNGWISADKKPVLNQLLWKELIPYFDDSRFTFSKIKGHQNLNNWNDYVDKIAKEAQSKIEN